MSNSGDINTKAVPDKVIKWFVLGELIFGGYSWFINVLTSSTFIPSH
jgi:hypothetical protein